MQSTMSLRRPPPAVLTAFSSFVVGVGLGVVLDAIGNRVRR
jgi:hypothetical protein